MSSPARTTGGGAPTVRHRAATLLTPPVTAAFHYLYYHQSTWMHTWWLGHRVMKNPLDLWIYQEMLYEQRPELIIETGTAHGGSALYLASICELIGTGRIVTVDVEDRSGRPVHERVRYIKGSSTDPGIVDELRAEADAASGVLVILDSDHSAAHVTAELAAYSPLVTRGSYVIVEDTNVNGHPVYRRFGPGPMEAVEAFVAGTHEFTVDRSREKFHFTFNPKGYLKRTSGGRVHAE